MRVERGAHGVTAERLTLAGGLDGVVASPERTGWSCRTSGRTACATTRCARPARTPGSSAARITGGATGIALDAATTISGTSIGLVDQGIRTQSPSLVHADDIDVSAVSVGINTAAGSPFLLTRSRVHALESVRGTLNAEGTQRPLPAAAEPARRDRDPAGAAGRGAAGRRGPAGAPLRR